jgi:hypothetical protein
MPNEEMSTYSPSDELSILNTIISVLKPLGKDTQQRILQTVMTFLGLDLPEKAMDIGPRHITKPLRSTEKTISGFSENKFLTPKEFLLEKQPNSDVERVACLAYYLTHYRATPHFKTIDISMLNTEAAQRKLSNPAVAVDNATKQGYLVPASKGQKQLSAQGEKFVQVLPDRFAAREIMARARPRRKAKEPKGVTKANELNDGQIS